MLVADYLEQHGLSADDVAARLAEHGVVSQQGNAISAVSVKRYVNLGRAVPKRWHGALGLEPPPVPRARAEPRRAPRDQDGPSRSGRSGELPPSRPDGAPIEISDTAGARRRIAGAYKFAGAALAAGSGSEGVAYVWADQSDPIAELWVQAAAENEWAARFVNLMSAGGTTGDLAAAHLYLAGATLYVLGAAIPAGDSIFAKYRPHRAAPAPAASNGHAATGAGAEPAPDGGAEASEPPAAGPVGFDQG